MASLYPFPSFRKCPKKKIPRGPISKPREYSSFCLTPPMNEPDRATYKRFFTKLKNCVVLSISTHSCGRPIISEGQIPSLPTLPWLSAFMLPLSGLSHKEEDTSGPIGLVFTESYNFHYLCPAKRILVAAGKPSIPELGAYFIYEQVHY